MDSGRCPWRSSPESHWNCENNRNNEPVAARDANLETKFARRGEAVDDIMDGSHEKETSMRIPIDRRTFIKQGLAVSTGSVLGTVSLPSILMGSDKAKVDLSIVHGTDYYMNTWKAVDALGGISSYVRKGNTVGLLINSPFDAYGTHTNPDIALAVLKMCVDAGAKEIYSIEGASSEYWKQSRLSPTFKDELACIQSDDERVTIRIEKGKSLKEAHISKRLVECDVLINIPIVKDHQGTKFTACLKNMMGACSSSTNRYFHQGSGKGGVFRFFQYYHNIEFLSQCIADVQLIRKPDLCIADATVFITTNGPGGPGELKKAQKIVAGAHCVSVDAYCATLLGFQPEDILMIQYASEHKIGDMNLKNLTIKEL
jgi:uncharacterized protein (DUF362 family)